jgi:hypothetical protein
LKIGPLANKSGHPGVCIEGMKIKIVKMKSQMGIKLKISGVARNLVWGVQLDIFGRIRPSILGFCELKAKSKL